VSTDAEEHRRQSAQFWEEAAPGWVSRQELIRQFGAPVSRWMVGAIDPKPGQHILELAGGLGDTGLMAADLVAPVGKVVISDQAEAMLNGARERASSLGLANVEFQVLNAEWIDLPVASVDAVLCRFGFMLMADPLTALRETRRVLRPGGRIALAVWDQPNLNPWALEATLELVQRGLSKAPDSEGQTQPGPFALGEHSRLLSLMQDAGFIDPLIESVDVQQRHPNFAEFWETLLDISRNFHDAVLDRPEAEIAEIRQAIERRLERFSASDGTLSIPGKALLACASA
jgi:ubiquinone/menaquinone biosynthesis C-methylase UbiE